MNFYLIKQYQNVTNITIYLTIIIVLSPQLAAGTFRLLHPGDDSICPWVSVCALGHSLGKGRTFTLYPLLEGCRAIRNTPDFMLEYFIVLFSAGT